MFERLLRMSPCLAVLLQLGTPLLASEFGDRLFEDEAGIPSLSVPLPVRAVTGLNTTTYTDEATFLGSSNCVVDLESFEGETATNSADQSSLPARGLFYRRT